MFAAPAKSPSSYQLVFPGRIVYGELLVIVVLRYANVDLSGTSTYVSDELLPVNEMTSTGIFFASTPDGTLFDELTRYVTDVPFSSVFWRAISAAISFRTAIPVEA